MSVQIQVKMLPFATSTFVSCQTRPTMKNFSDNLQSKKSYRRHPCENFWPTRNTSLPLPFTCGPCWKALEPDASRMLPRSLGLAISIFALMAAKQTLKVESEEQAIPGALCQPSKTLFFGTLKPFLFGDEHFCSSIGFWGSYPRVPTTL